MAETFGLSENDRFTLLSGIAHGKFYLVSVSSVLSDKIGNAVRCI